MDKVFSVLCFLKKEKMFNFNQSDAVAFILPKLSDANYFFKVNQETKHFTPHGPTQGTGALKKHHKFIYLLHVTFFVTYVTPY